MQKIMRTSVLLAGTLSLGLAAHAQQPAATAPAAAQSRAMNIDLAVMYDAEYSRVAGVNGQSFWLNGGSADAAITLYKGLGVAINFGGEHASNITPGVNFGKVAYMAGPRYTFNATRSMSRLTGKHSTQIFGEWLVGGVHGFDSVFPASGGVVSTANAFSTQLGGGADVAIAQGFGMRVLELDFVHTSLPNNAGNSQNDLRIGFGVTFRH